MSARAKGEERPVKRGQTNCLAAPSRDAGPSALVYPGTTGLAASQDDEMNRFWRCGLRGISSAPVTSHLHSKGENQAGTEPSQKTQCERTGSMRKALATTLSIVAMISLSATMGMAQTSCPAEVASAKAMLTQTAKGQDVQASRSLAGARSQDIQSPRSQDIQSPRSQDIQSPRSQDIQSPRSAAFKKASTLVSEAEVACKAGKSSVAADKAKAAMELLKK